VPGPHGPDPHFCKSDTAKCGTNEYENEDEDKDGEEEEGEAAKGEVEMCAYLSKVSKKVKPRSLGLSQPSKARLSPPPPSQRTCIVLSNFSTLTKADADSKKETRSNTNLIIPTIYFYAVNSINLYK